MWVGYVTFGFISDRFGRKKSYVAYLLSAAVLLAVYVTVRDPTLLLILGPCVAFAATGYFSGFGAVTAEVYPTSIRATAQGFTYNIGRARERRGALPGRHARRHARLRRRAARVFGRVHRGGGVLDTGSRRLAAGYLLRRAALLACRPC